MKQLWFVSNTPFSDFRETDDPETLIDLMESACTGTWGQNADCGVSVVLYVSLYAEEYLRLDPFTDSIIGPYYKVGVDEESFEHIRKTYKQTLIGSQAYEPTPDTIKYHHTLIYIREPEYNIPLQYINNVVYFIDGLLTAKNGQIPMLYKELTEW